MIHERIYLNEAKTAYLDSYAVTLDEECAKDAILVIPGGGYAGVCNGREGERIALAFAARGVNAFSLTYSVGEDVRFPCQLLEAARAVAYIKENAAKYCIKPDRIFATGFSAGGHLLGTLSTLSSLAERELELPDGAVRLAGLVYCYPVISAKYNTHGGSFANLLKKPLSEYTEEEKNLLSVEHNVSETTPPAFIWHTATDQIVPVQNSLLLAKAYADAGVPFCAHIYPQGPHGVALGTRTTYVGRDDFINPEASEWVDKACEWMKNI